MRGAETFIYSHVINTPLTKRYMIDIKSHSLSSNWITYTLFYASAFYSCFDQFQVSPAGLAHIFLLVSDLNFVRHSPYLLKPSIGCKYACSPLHQLLVLADDFMMKSREMAALKSLQESLETLKKQQCTSFGFVNGELTCTGTWNTAT